MPLRMYVRGVGDVLLEGHRRQPLLVLVLADEVLEVRRPTTMVSQFLCVCVGEGVCVCVCVCVCVRRSGNVCARCDEVPYRR